MATALRELSNALAEAVSSLEASTVRIEARRRMPASGVAWSTDGLIVTADHAVEAEDEIRVGLNDGKTVGAVLVGRDASTDLALLRVEAALEPPDWRPPDALRVGHLVLALARPGRTLQATLGIVSALGDAWQTPGGGQVDRFLQSDVVMPPGFSGGPLVGAAGEVWGVTTTGLVRGMCLALPVPTVARVVEALTAHGRIRRGYLGIGAQPVRLPTAVGDTIGQSSGLILLAVEPGGPADKAGLLLGDVLVTVGGRPVLRMDDLVAMLDGELVGESIPLRLVRGGVLQDLTVSVGERPHEG